MNWKDAACRGANTERWFPERGTSGRETREAKAVCARCPVRVECGDYGRNEDYGIWGGRTATERGMAGWPRRPQAAA